MQCQINPPEHDGKSYLYYRLTPNFEQDVKKLLTFLFLSQFEFNSI